LIKLKKNNDNMKKKYYVNTKNLYENILISLKDNVKFFRWEKKNYYNMLVKVQMSLDRV
jgi:hypothetical protein